VLGDAAQAPCEPHGGIEDESAYPTDAELRWKRTLRDQAVAHGVALPGVGKASGSTMCEDDEEVVQYISGSMFGVADTGGSAGSVSQRSDGVEGGLRLDAEASSDKDVPGSGGLPRTMSTTASNGDAMCGQVSETMCRTEGQLDSWMDNRQDEVVFQMSREASMPSGLGNTLPGACLSPTPSACAGFCFGRQDMDQGFEETPPCEEQAEVSSAGACFPYCFLFRSSSVAGASSHI